MSDARHSDPICTPAAYPDLSDGNVPPSSSLATEPVAFDPSDATSATASSYSSLCLHCARLGAENQVGSSECIQSQSQLGCHACGRHCCFSTSSTCPFFNRARETHADAQATGSPAADIFPRSIVHIHRRPNCTEVSIDGVRFEKGQASGVGNNCLIDALREAIHEHIPCVVDNAWVRSRLVQRFPQTGENAVTQLSFLDFRLHWRATIDFIGESARNMGHDTLALIRAESFRVVCVEETTRVVGDADGDGTLELHLLNERQLHYVPLLRRATS